MNAKELKIEAPEGYEVDWENCSMNTIRFKPIKKKITYKDVINNIKAKNIGVSVQFGLTKIGTDCFITSEKQLEQLLALNKLINVAKYLNGDWEPDFTDNKQQKWFIEYNVESSILDTDFAISYKSSVVYFKTSELAHQAIEILGEKEIKVTLGIFE